MNWNAISFDWNQVRAFLATAEEGSLSAAARALGQTQPTLSRQISSLERDLGVVLFERQPRKMALTETGFILLDHVRVMGEAAAHLSLSASGQSQAIEGHVSITATDMTATYLLPPILMQLQAKAPNIQIEIISSNDVRDLTKREADIAIRHARPEQADLIAKLVGTSAAHLYASPTYLASAGKPENTDDLKNFNFVGMSPVERFLPTLKSFGLDIKEDQFKAAATNGNALLELVRHGMGIGILPRHSAKLFPDLVPLLQESISFPIPIWLVSHRELRTSQRIRCTFDFLNDSLTDMICNS